MRMPWQKHDIEYIDNGEGKPRKPKETLKQTAEKILQRKMKKDPDNFGIKTSERILGLSEDGKSLAAQLKELKETQSLLREIGGTNQGGGWLKELGQGLAEGVAPLLTAALQQKVQQPEPQPRQLPQQRQLQESRISLGLPAAQASLTGLLPLLDLEAVDAIQELKNMAEDGDPQGQAWLSLLKQESYGGLMRMLEELQENEEYAGIISAFLDDKRRNWVKELCRLAKSTEEGIKAQAKDDKAKAKVQESDA